MTDKMKIALCYTALAIATIFLVVAVDYLPYIVCWLPVIIVGYCASQCKAFMRSFARVANYIIPE